MSPDMIRQKLMQFQQELDAKVEAERQRQEKELQGFRQQELEKYADDALADAYQLIQGEVAQQDTLLNKAASEKRMERRKELFACREEYTRQVFAQVQQRLEAFAASPQYPAFLRELVAQMAQGCPAGEGSVLLLRREDLPRAQELLPLVGKGCQVQESEEIRLGGAVLQNRALGFRDDQSLDSRLREQQQHFCEESELSIEL